MKPRTMAGVVALVALVAFSWFAERANARLRGQVNAAKDARRASDAAVRAAGERRAAALSAREASEKALASLTKAREGSDARAPRDGATARRIPTIAERLRTEPDAQVLWLKLQRARAEMSYGPLLLRLGVTAEQRARFEENFLRKQEQEMDLTAIATEERNRTGRISAETAAALGRIQPDYEAAQRTLLGDSGYQQLREYERTTWVRKWVDGWAGGAAVYIGEPFSAAQGEQLIQAIANANESYRKGGDAVGNVDWTAVNAAAKSLLTPNQYRMFSTTEPPLPTGGRYQVELYLHVNAASSAEAKPPGKG